MRERRQRMREYEAVSEPSSGADLARRVDLVRQVDSNVAENIQLADTEAGLIAAGPGRC